MSSTPSSPAASNSVSSGSEVSMLSGSTPSDSVPFSFEVYPPRNREATPGLLTTIDRFCQVGPQFISVTYGAGGKTLNSSKEVLRYIRSKGVDAMAHFTCVGSTYAEAAKLIKDFINDGVTNFLALRGDLVEGSTRGLGDLGSAAELVQLIRAVWQEKYPWVDLGFAQKVAMAQKVRVAVAAFPNGHPQSRSIEQDLDTLLAKQAAGATMAITQIFFYAQEYLSYCEKAKAWGVEIPILPGIMPILSPARLDRVLELVGHEYPSQLGIALEVEPDVHKREEIGITWATNLAKDVLAAGAPGLHLYAFNQHESVLEVLRRCSLIA